MKCDILNLDWSSAGRDREAAIPVCYALRQKGYSIVEASIFNYRHYLLKYKPKLLFVAGGSVGATINYQAIKFAHEIGVPVVTGTAEGIYFSEYTEKFFWGHNFDKNLLEQLNFQWSVRARDLAIELVPRVSNQLKITGASGFDRYQFYRFRSKQAWMDKYGYSYSRMIGYAGWAFDALYREAALADLGEIYSRNQFEQLRQSGLEINKILRVLIEEYQDTLFLLKEHPGVVNRAYSELANLQNYTNVLYLRNEEAVGDCINGCDIWMAFESTTCLEAWLLGKPTLMINPSGSNFVRTNICKGNPILKNAAEVKQVFEEYYTSRVISEFEAKRIARQQIVEETIQWADGKNHLRMVYYIEKLLQRDACHYLDISIKEKIEAFIQNSLYGLSPFMPNLWRFRTYKRARAIFSQDELDDLYQRYMLCLDAFYQHSTLSAEDIVELEAINCYTQDETVG